MVSTHTIHENHTHQHGPDCGHTPIHHDDHNEYLHYLKHNSHNRQNLNYKKL